MKLSRVCWLLLPAFLLGMIPACGNKSDKIKVAIVTNNPAEFWSICEAGARKAAKEFDVDLIFRKPEKGEVTVQMDIVNALSKQGIAGIGVSVLDPEEQAPDLKILAGKMKLVTIDNDADGSDRICYVGTDNYAAGHAVGQLVREVLPEGGTLAIFVGKISPINARQRFWGLIDELNGIKERKDFPDAKIKGLVGGAYKVYRNEAITDQSNPEQAQVNAMQAVGKIGTEPNVCMVGLWAYNTPKNLEAVRSDAKFKHVKLVAFDEDWATLDGIDTGEIYATVVQDPFNFGYKSVEILAAEARGDKSKSNIKPIPYRVITKTGGDTKTIDGVEIKNIKAAEFRDHLKALLDSVK